MWCYRRMLKIKYSDHATNRKVREITGVDKKNNWRTELAKRKIKDAGHVLRGSARELAQLMLEERVEGKRSQGRPRKTRGDDVKEWTKVVNIGRAKRTAEKQLMWQTMVPNIQIEEANFD